MGYQSIGQAIFVRFLFASHGLITVWRLTLVTKESRYWYLTCTLILLFLEAAVTLCKRHGKEWKWKFTNTKSVNLIVCKCTICSKMTDSSPDDICKRHYCPHIPIDCWFCPSVFIYLMSSVPAIWFLELHEFERRMIEYLSSNHTPPLYYTDQYEDLSAPLGSVLGVKFEIRIPIEMTSDQWIRTLEQILLLILILGRWLLPKGKLTHDQLSQLLLVYIGTAADIVEFFEAFKEVQVRYDKILCMTILGLWSLSLMQFSLVLTAARARRDQSGLLSRRSDIQSGGCCGTDVFGIIISILLQDLPFLVLRMLLIFRYHVLSYSNMFFTCKNTLVIVLLIYRLVVVFVQRRLRERELLTDSPKIKIPPILTSPSHSCTGSLESRSILLSPYPTKHTHPVHRVYQLREEKHKWGRAYHFEEVD